MQLLLRIAGRAGNGSLLELLLLRLDEQGIEISSPWAPQPGPILSELLWPQLWQAWRAKETLSQVDFRAPVFSSGESFAQWEQAKQCIQILGKLGHAGIFQLSDLRGQAGRWLTLQDIRPHACPLTASEYQTLCSWLDRVPVLHLVSVASNLSTDVSIPLRVPDSLRHTSCTCGRHMMHTPCAALPPCIRGRARSTQSHDMVRL